MKKLIGFTIALTLSFSLISCKKKTKANTTTKKTTTTLKTTTKKTTTIDIPRDNINYESDYTPIVSNKLPRIDIVVNDPTIPSEEKTLAEYP